jgi:hypothetical protein
MTGVVQKKVSPTLLYGGLASLGVVLYIFCTWRGGISTFLGSIAYFMYLIPVGFAIAGGLAAKKRGQGFIGFRALLQVCFGIIVLTLAVQQLFIWMLVHVIDPQFGRELIPASLAKAVATYRRFGMPEDQISSYEEAVKGTDPFSIGSILGGLAKLYIVGFPIAALMAILIRRKAPLGVAVNT